MKEPMFNPKTWLFYLLWLGLFFILIMFDLTEVFFFFFFVRSWLVVRDWLVFDRHLRFKIQ